MYVDITRRVPVARSYRVDRAIHLFNVGVDLGQKFHLQAELPISAAGEPEGDWSIGVVAGPSGSGKSTVGAELVERGWTMWGTEGWPRDAAIIDAIAPDASFDEVAAGLASVGLGTVPSWLRPYRVLSNGERFRAELARLLLERPARTVIDEYSSVIDRRVAQIGSQAFAKAWRRGGGDSRVVLLTPHFDVLPWIKPDWVTQTTLTGQTVSSMEPLITQHPEDPVVGVVRA